MANSEASTCSTLAAFINFYEILGGTLMEFETFCSKVTCARNLLIVVCKDFHCSLRLVRRGKQKFAITNS